MQWCDKNYRLTIEYTVQVKELSGPAARLVGGITTPLGDTPILCPGYLADSSDTLPVVTVNICTYMYICSYVYVHSIHVRMYGCNTHIRINTGNKMSV